MQPATPNMALHCVAPTTGRRSGTHQLQTPRTAVSAATHRATRASCELRCRRGARERRRCCRRRQVPRSLGPCLIDPPATDAAVCTGGHERVRAGGHHTGDAAGMRCKAEDRHVLERLPAGHEQAARVHDADVAERAAQRHERVALRMGSRHKCGSGEVALAFQELLAGSAAQRVEVCQPAGAWLLLWRCTSVRPIDTNNVECRSA